ncbi:YtxH domain-containing protein [Leucobacter massiliensis]|uniref:YtxH domain-containing protein n=1 Tax=Leucobacter massiliensis TaxID=1686285 RepID=UPI0015E3F4FC|nr:YtxH domain-containing protein [Leucobacter massiliensis]
MKGKVAFVVGAAVGYVLGTRAGRERYEQIKQGAQKLWSTEPVQKGVELVQGVAQTRLDEVKAVLARAGKGAMSALFSDSSGSGSRGAAGARTAPKPSDFGARGTSAAASEEASSGSDQTPGGSKQASSGSKQASSGSKQASSGAKQATGTANGSTAEGDRAGSGKPSDADGDS